MSKNGKKLLAVTVLRETEDRTKVKVIAMNIEVAKTETSTEAIARAEIRVGWKIANLTRGEELWTRVEDIRGMERNGDVLVGARVNGEVTIAKVQIPKKLWGKERMWKILTKKQQTEQLQEMHPYAELSEVIVQPEEWNRLSAEAKRYGMYAEEWGSFM